MTQKHEELKDAAVEALRELHGDTSVSQRQTIESLEEVVSEARLLIALVEHDIAVADDTND